MMKEAAFTIRQIQNTLSEMLPGLETSDRPELVPFPKLQACKTHAWRSTTALGLWSPSGPRSNPACAAKQMRAISRDSG